MTIVRGLTPLTGVCRVFILAFNRMAFTKLSTETGGNRMRLTKGLTLALWVGFIIALPLSTHAEKGWTGLGGDLKSDVRLGIYAPHRRL